MKDQTALVGCHDCRQFYGRWRTRCPACGSENRNRQSLTDAVASFSMKDAARVTTPRRVRKQCIFCHLRGAKETCPTCNEPVHRGCQATHGPLCGQFVEEIHAEEKKLAPAQQTSVAAAPGPNALHHPASVADQINQRLKNK